jgi:hypothetical protein
MTKEFVPYELAVKLKAIGFDEPCFAFRKDPDMLFIAYYNQPAPTFSQAFRWFREEYNIHGQISVLEDENWHYSVRQKSNNYNINFPEKTRFRTFEEAELACLDKLIEIIELKQQEQ